MFVARSIRKQLHVTYRVHDCEVVGWSLTQQVNYEIGISNNLFRGRITDQEGVIRRAGMPGTNMKRKQTVALTKN